MEKLWLSTVFLGLTRPPMLFGVTIEYLSVIFMITISAFILGDSFRYLLVYFPLHTVGWLACQLDHHIFRLLGKKLECQVSPNKKIWGCQSYDPM